MVTMNLATMKTTQREERSVRKRVDQVIRKVLMDYAMPMDV